MTGSSADEYNQGCSSPAPAFVIYHLSSKNRNDKGEVFYNAEGWQVLSGIKPSVNPASLCARWKRRFDEKLVAKSGGPAGEREARSGFIDLCKSGDRRYGILGFILRDHLGDSPKQGRHHLFLFERIVPEGVNLCMISRLWGLCRREEEIVRLLLLERSNKEIAHHLNLSLNTIKGYLKLLMRKLGVQSRAGVLACLLTGRNLSSPLPPESIASRGKRHPRR